ncbi:DedA family protein [Dethiothermospora halolimnae]|uniref:DedA family protein n=1 Tax=Dethiothermospora halolimnae TaxID=3114390 RepID=UPI003CCBACB1
MNMSIIDIVSDTLINFSEKASIYGYITIPIAMLVEGAAIPFPGTFILILSGYLIKKFSLNPIIIISLSSICYTLAAMVPYAIGSQVNGIAKKRFNKFMSKNEHQIDKMSRLFEKYGEVAVCVSRLTFIGNYFSYIAGINKMNKKKFLFYTILGMTPWIVLMNVIGYKVGENADQLKSLMDKFGPLFYMIIGLPFVVFIALRYGYKIIKKSQ